MKYLRILLISILFILPVIIYAKGDVTVDTEKLIIEKGKSAVLSINADNSAGRVNFSAENKNIIELDKDKEWIENQSIQINVKGLKEGKTKINIEINAATFDEKSIKKTHTIEVEVKSNGTSNNFNYLIIALSIIVVVAIIFVFKLKKK